MKRLNWLVLLGLVLILVSAALYFLHYALFRDAQHIFIYLLGDLAFLPIEVLLVAVIVHQLLARREKRALLGKMNMVIGAFFSEVGYELLRMFLELDARESEMRTDLLIASEWTARDFVRARRQVAAIGFRLDSRKSNFEALKRLLLGRRGFLLGLLENPNLLEHESFTEMLWAVFHLTEELAGRSRVHALPGADYEHVAGDIKRVYGSLVTEWLAYMQHLRAQYPYLYSLAVRTNPFDRNATAEVK